MQAVEGREYIIVCENKKHSYRRHNNVNSAICEAIRLTRKFGHIFTVCKVKGSVQEAASQPRQHDQLGE